MPGILNVKVSTATFDRRVLKTRIALTVPGSPLAKSLKRHFNRRVKPEYVKILRREMSANRERKILNEGFVVRRGGEVFVLPGGKARSVVGVGSGGRFLAGSHTAISVAVAQEPVHIDPTAAGFLRVGAVNRKVIQQKTSFRWLMRTKEGKVTSRGRTMPFGKQFLQVLESGGVVSVPNFGRLVKDPRVIVGTVTKEGPNWVWRVKHRRGKRLWPEEGVFVWTVKKTVAPIGMFRRALFSKARVTMMGWEEDFKNYLIRSVGFGGPSG